MNHCLLEVTVKVAPTIRYTQDNQTAIAEMDVSFDGLRADDPPGSIKVVGWGNLAQELHERVQVGQKLVLEGRLRMNTIPRQDGSKEKKAELTLSKIHSGPENNFSPSNMKNDSQNQTSKSSKVPQDSKNPDKIEKNEGSVTWDSSPLIPDTDDIPF